MTVLTTTTATATTTAPPPPPSAPPLPPTPTPSLPPFPRCPPSQQETVLLDFSPVEKACYDIIFERAQERASAILTRLPKHHGRHYRHGSAEDDADAGDGRSMVEVLALLVRLRQTCITQTILPKGLRISEVRAGGGARRRRHPPPPR